MASVVEYATIGNILMIIIFLLIFNQLLVLYQFREMPPGPRLTSLPFIGNLLSFDSGDSFMEITASLRKKYGKVFSVKIGSFKVVIAGDTASVKELLVRKSADYAGRPPLYSFLRSTFAKYFPFRAYQLMNNMLDQVYEILRRQLKIQERESSNSTEIDSLTGSFLQERAVAENEVGAEERVAFLSDEYMLSNMRDMFVAGYDTTSSTLRWAIAFLVHHPKIQKEVQNQLDEVVGKDRVPNLDDLPNLPLVQAMIMETQRLGNVAENTIPHYTLKDTTLAGFRIPKDTIVFATLAQVHLDPGCWENPYSFNPHRHIDADGQLITNTGNFLPFSAGRRVCAGEALAKVELFLFLTWMLHKFTFLPSEEGTVPDLKGHTGLTHFPALYKIRAKKRLR
ncbi:steroid 17-alpha-hydroxylase/17,20 lyase-like isoform X2 [Stylophora pistillata]|uniref:steroid 17-alpha-hydroxylase/17,20 lyase-like isoform X2 n=1 Tax=Stylophora pistillata TaxID=50429 RepID=UPI000C047637|nr:steroid 17-alpha-hydroxylase/17,20 lyase-like isoform X2 [Stylophora pistillata]